MSLLNQPIGGWRGAASIRWLVAALLIRASSAFGADTHKPGAVDFNRDVRPIFAENCYACHGPDRNRRKAGLRLDQKEGAFVKLDSGKLALVPGEPGKSELIARITTAEPDDKMPPAKSGKHLTPTQIDVLRRWVAEGAQWKQHWAYVVPERAPLPPVKDSQWPRNPIDRFTLQKIEQAGMRPAPEAGKPALIRRASLDLVGLPPTIEEVDAFLSDKSPAAYEKVVDRLLASKHFGERMALNWLDLARYADTSGYHFDGVRFMWLWRDWVINAFNQNMPYSQFTVEQLAGDLLPNPTTSQRIASGFNRNNMTTDEGGADPDEYLNKYAVDRVNTTGIVWLGLTVGCAECHDHKYDRLTQKEFYQLYAFFNNVPEKGLDRIRTDNPPPRLAVPTPEQAVQLVERDFVLRDAEKTLQDRENELGETQEKWERLTQAKPPAPMTTNGLLALLKFDESLDVQGEETAVKAMASFKMVGTEKPVYADGRVGKALQLSGTNHLDCGQLVELDRTNTFSYGAWTKLQKESGCILSKMEGSPSYRGFDVLTSEGHFEVHLVHQWPDDAIKIRTKDSFPQNQWLHVMVTYDGSAKAAGLKLLVDGKVRELEVQHDTLTNSFANAEPLRIGTRKNESPLTGLVDDLRVYSRAFAVGDVNDLLLEDFLPLVMKSRGHRSGEEQEDLRRFYREHHAIAFLSSQEALAKAKQAKDEIIKAIPTSMVMQEMDKPRETHLLVRGDFRNPGEKVDRGVPSFLPPLLGAAACDRLALARWLVATNHPLMARVTVNRYWQLFFGTGLVKTLNDFGTQGEWPSHPELLDWLACQFRDGGVIEQREGAGSRRERRTVPAWDVKELVRLLVTSATYRQSAAITPEKLERDSQNRLLSRGPRRRLDAEFIRDNALAISGLLDSRIGGPSVKPYQPPGIWDGTDAEYKQDRGADLYRRGMYVFWRRSAHYPSFATFDAPNREVCTFLRQRTQTPLQSLVLMNDPAYLEAARALAQRLLREEPGDLERRLTRGFRLTLARAPRPEELAVIKRAYDQQLANSQKDAQTSEGWLSSGESPHPEHAEQAQLAALTAVASALLNLNETLSN